MSGGRYRFVTVDVFASERYAGNPLAVLPEAAGLDGAAMQRIAREFNLSETAFVLPPEEPGHGARVRIFTPTREMPFAGHPNIGTGFVLAAEMAARGEAVPEVLLFEEIAGLVGKRTHLRRRHVQQMLRPWRGIGDTLGQLRGGFEDGQRQRRLGLAQHLDRHQHPGRTTTDDCQVQFAITR